MQFFEKGMIHWHKTEPRQKKVFEYFQYTLRQRHWAGVDMWTVIGNKLPYDVHALSFFRTEYFLDFILLLNLFVEHKKYYTNFKFRLSNVIFHFAVNWSWCGRTARPLETILYCCRLSLFYTRSFWTNELVSFRDNLEDHLSRRKKANQTKWSRPCNSSYSW